MLLSERDTHDRDSEQKPEEKVIEHQNPAEEYEPDDIEKGLQGRNIALRFDFFAKRDRHRPAHADLLQSDRYPDYGRTGRDAGGDGAEGGGKAAEDKPDYVA